MAKYLAWIGATVIALAGIVIGVLPIDTGPRWVWLTIGIVFGLVAALTFLAVWRTNSSDSQPSINQRLTAGKNSRIIQAGGDVDLKGGMGDDK